MFTHVFRVIFVSVVSQFPKISSGKPQSGPRNRGNSPQLTTKTEDTFYSQRNGPSTTLDITLAGKARKAKPESKLRIESKQKSPILERMGLENMPAIT
jgi:hypothetical protein